MKEESADCLSKATVFFNNVLGLYPVAGAETEFFLCSVDNPDKLLSKTEKTVAANNSFLKGFTKEKGKNQFEAIFNHTKDTKSLAGAICYVRDIITSESKKSGGEAIFASKPYADDYGNGMHIHLSISDNTEKNILSKVDGEESLMMQYVIGGLIEMMPFSMSSFCPLREDFQRFEAKYNAPVTVSWGGNNRTVSIRLPTTTLDPQNRRIEHRVPAASSDPYRVIYHILLGSAYGIFNKILPSSEKVYGDASLDQYNLVSINDLHDYSEDYKLDKLNFESLVLRRAPEVN